jgi:hypothetical protein
MLAIVLQEELGLVPFLGILWLITKLPALG